LFVLVSYCVFFALRFLVLSYLQTVRCKFCRCIRKYALWTCQLWQWEVASSTPLVWSQGRFYRFFGSQIHSCYPPCHMIKMVNSNSPIHWL